MDFSIVLFVTCFIAGILTVFAPCIFTFLPIILGASNTSAKKDYQKALTIIMSLGISVFVFSLLLKASTSLIQIPNSVWDIVAGGIILAQGLILLYPLVWDKLSIKLGMYKASNLLTKTDKYKGKLGDVLTGAALGPIFSSCSPTYGFIIGALLISGFSIGLLYLSVYILGVCIMLFAISILGQNMISKLKWATNPEGTFKRIIAVMFILIGLLIATGFYKDLEAFIIENLPFLDITKLDRTILERSVN